MRRFFVGVLATFFAANLICWLSVDSILVRVEDTEFWRGCFMLFLLVQVLGVVAPALALLAVLGRRCVRRRDPLLIQISGSLAMLTSRAPDSFEYQMLYGIRPAEQRRLANTGAHMRVYVPYGGDWYAYLVRRLAERPGNLALFLRSLRSRG